jgi:hypothetical protein
MQFIRDILATYRARYLIAILRQPILCRIYILVGLILTLLNQIEFFNEKIWFNVISLIFITMSILIAIIEIVISYWFDRNITRVYNMGGIPGDPYYNPKKVDKNPWIEIHDIGSW